MKLPALLLFLSSIWIRTYGQSIIYVDANNTGTQNGQSWSTAFSDLQGALTTSAAGDSIFVADGDYYPNSELAGSTDPRDKAFLIPSGVALFGGFVGNESSITDRSLDSMSLHVTNRTRLSGDIGTLNDPTDNCYHVIVSILSSNSTLIDGFTISDANANGQDSIVVNGVDVFRKYGGGLNLTTSFLTLTNCVVRDNVASRGGGGINNNDSDPNIETSTFYFNSVIWNDDQDPNSGGGAMRNDASHPNIYQTAFKGNDCYAAQGGGAIRNENASNPTFDHSRIRDNSTTFGGDGGAGMYNATGSAPSDSVADSTIVTFSSNANVTSITQYQWLKNGSAISGATDSAYVAQANVDFVDGDLISLKMESNQQCVVANAITFSNEIEMMLYAIADTTDTTNNDTIIGIWENSNTAEFDVYPNPTNTGMVTFESDEDHVFEVSIFDLTGRMVFAETASARIHHINVSNLQPSTYAVSVKHSDGSVSTKRLIITR
jgi:hypothetical protein